MEGHRRTPDVPSARIGETRNDLFRRRVRKEGRVKSERGFHFTLGYSMISPFDFFGITRICFGRGQIARLGELAAPFGQSAMVIFNGPDTSAALSHQITVAEFRRQRGEPTVADIDATSPRRSRSARFSSASAAVCPSTRPRPPPASSLMADRLSITWKSSARAKKSRSRPSPGSPCRPPPARAEVTRNAVIGLPEKQFKASIRSEFLLPRAATSIRNWASMSRRLPPLAAAWMRSATHRILHLPPALRRSRMHWRSP